MFNNAAHSKHCHQPHRSQLWYLPHTLPSTSQLSGSWTDKEESPSSWSKSNIFLWQSEREICSVITVRWCYTSLDLFMIHLFWTKRSGFSSKISILSKKILIRLNVVKNVGHTAWNKIWLPFVLVQIKACQNKKFLSCFRAEIVIAKMEMNDICKCMMRVIWLKTNQFLTFIYYKCPIQW